MPGREKSIIVHPKPLVLAAKGGVLKKCTVKNSDKENKLKYTGSSNKIKKR